MNERELVERVALYTRFAPRDRLNVVHDTSEFMNISAGDVLELQGRYFLVRGEEVEGRFGLDGEPKFWVKKTIDLADGTAKIIKLVFHESFNMRLGEMSIRCFRSPQKEARILEKIKGDLRFMQGQTLLDSVGNPARVIDRIQGNRLYDLFDESNHDHETYFHTQFPAVFRQIVSCIEAIARLHALGEVHGDIRNDHILIERGTGRYIWIDFDYTYEWAENPAGVDLYGLGNVLLFTIGQGFHTLPDLAACAPAGMQLKTCLEPADFSLFFRHRITNLRKLFPYIPESLNQVLEHFSQGCEVFYENTTELLDDLGDCTAELPR
jgi:tRNA A-37 threonylcarbamoyl transferase component Bud32